MTATSITSANGNGVEKRSEPGERSDGGWNITLSITTKNLITTQNPRIITTKNLITTQNPHIITTKNPAITIFTDYPCPLSGSGSSAPVGVREWEANPWPDLKCSFALGFWSLVLNPCALLLRFFTNSAMRTSIGGGVVGCS